MSEYLVETYISQSEPSGVVPRSADVANAADQVAREGQHVRLVRAIVVPEEETCFYLFSAETEEAVRAAATRAGLCVQRIVEAVPDWLAPSEADHRSSSNFIDTTVNQQGE